MPGEKAQCAKEEGKAPSNQGSLRRALRAGMHGNDGAAALKKGTEEVASPAPPR